MPARRLPAISSVSPFGATRWSTTVPSPEKSLRSRILRSRVLVVARPGALGSMPVSRTPINTPRPSASGCALWNASTPVEASPIHPRAYAASGGATLGRSGGDGGGGAVELSSLIDALDRLSGTESMFGLAGFLARAVGADSGAGAGAAEWPPHP